MYPHITSKFAVISYIFFRKIMSNSPVHTANIAHTMCRAHICICIQCASQRERGGDSGYVGWGGVDCKDYVSAGTDSDTCNDCRSAARASVSTAFVALITSVPQLMIGELVAEGYSIKNHLIFSLIVVVVGSNWIKFTPHSGQFN